MAHPSWAWIEAQKQNGRADIFRFRFDRAPLTPEGWFGQRLSREAGAFHAGEILYVFDNLDAFPWLIDDADRQLAKLASSYWVNFVRNGDPNGPDLPPAFLSRRRCAGDGARHSSQGGAGGMARAPHVPQAGSR